MTSINNFQHTAAIHQILESLRNNTLAREVSNSEELLRGIPLAKVAQSFEEAVQNLPIDLITHLKSFIHWT